MATQGYVSWDDFLPEILQYANGAPSILLRQNIRKTIIEFCERTLVLKKDPSTLSLEQDVHTYTLKYSGDRYRAIAIDEVKFGETDDNEPLTRTTDVQLDGSYRNWRNMTSSKPTMFFLTEETNKIRFVAMPQADIDDEDLYIRSRVTFMRDQTEFDEFLYEKWSDYIEAGAISRVLLMEGASWYNPALGSAFALEYRRGIREARKTTLTGTGKFSGRVQPQSFGNIGSNQSNIGDIYSWD